MTDDEAIVAHTAARKLRGLYEAYRVTSRANVLVLRRISEGLRTSDPQFEAKARQLLERIALSRRTDLAFAIRTEDIRRRMLRLREEHPMP